MSVRRTFSNAPWEKNVGYCRALRVGNQVFVTGTAPIDENGRTFAPGKPFEQAQRCFEIIARALSDLDAPISSVVRTRMFVTDISKWAEFGRAHAEVFGTDPPTTTMVQVQQLIDKEMLIEVEVDAVVEG